MRSIPTLTLSVLTLASLEAMAALSTSVPPAWLKAGVSIPGQSRSPLYITLSPDMEACRAQYPSLELKRRALPTASRERRA